MATIVSLNLLLTADANPMLAGMAKAEAAAERYSTKVDMLGTKLASGLISQSKFDAELDKATQVFHRASGAMAILDANRTGVQRFNDEMHQLSTLLKVGSLDIENFNIAARRSQAMHIGPPIANLVETKVLMQSAMDLQTKMFARGAAITEQQRTPFERQAASLAELNQLLKAGAITQGTHARAVAQTNKEYMQAQVSMAGFSRIMQFAAPTAIITAGFALERFLKSSFEQTKQSIEQSRAIGLTVGEFETIGHVAALAGVAQDTMRLGIEKMLVALGDASIKGAKLLPHSTTFG